MIKFRLKLIAGKLLLSIIKNYGFAVSRINCEHRFCPRFFSGIWITFIETKVIRYGGEENAIVSPAWARSR